MLLEFAGHVACWRLEHRKPKLTALNASIHLNANIFL